MTDMFPKPNQDPTRRPNQPASFDGLIGFPIESPIERASTQPLTAHQHVHSLLTARSGNEFLNNLKKNSQYNTDTLISATTRVLESLNQKAILNAEEYLFVTRGAKILASLDKGGIEAISQLLLLEESSSDFVVSVLQGFYRTPEISIHAAVVQLLEQEDVLKVFAAADVLASSCVQNGGVGAELLSFSSLELIERIRLHSTTCQQYAAQVKSARTVVGDVLGQQVANLLAIAPTERDFEVARKAMRDFDANKGSHNVDPLRTSLPQIYYGCLTHILSEQEVRDWLVDRFVNGSRADRSILTALLTPEDAKGDVLETLYAAGSGGFNPHKKEVLKNPAILSWIEQTIVASLPALKESHRIESNIAIRVCSIIRDPELSCRVIQHVLNTPKLDDNFQVVQLARQLAVNLAVSHQCEPNAGVAKYIHAMQTIAREKFAYGTLDMIRHLGFGELFRRTPVSISGNSFKKYGNFYQNRLIAAAMLDPVNLESKKLLEQGSSSGCNELRLLCAYKLGKVDQLAREGEGQCLKDAGHMLGYRFRVGLIHFAATKLAENSNVESSLAPLIIATIDDSLLDSPDSESIRIFQSASDLFASVPTASVNRASVVRVIVKAMYSQNPVLSLVLGFRSAALLNDISAEEGQMLAGALKSHEVSASIGRRFNTAHRDLCARIAENIAAAQNASASS